MHVYFYCFGTPVFWRDVYDVIVYLEILTETVHW